MGKAMVSTSIGCEGLDVRPDEHLLVADTPEQFVEKTVMLLENPDRRLVLGRAARHLTECQAKKKILQNEPSPNNEHE